MIKNTLEARIKKLEKIILEQDNNTIDVYRLVQDTFERFKEYSEKIATITEKDLGNTSKIIRVIKDDYDKKLKSANAIYDAAPKVGERMADCVAIVYEDSDCDYNVDEDDQYYLTYSFRDKSGEEIATMNLMITGEGLEYDWVEDEWDNYRSHCYTEDLGVILIKNHRNEIADPDLDTERYPKAWPGFLKAAEIINTGILGKSVKA